MLLSGFDVHFSFGLRILGDLKIVQGNGALVVENLRAIELLANQDFAGRGLAIICERRGDVRTLHAQEYFPFLHGVAEARANFHHTAAGERDHGDGAADVRAHDYRDGERRGLHGLGCLYDWKLFRMLNLQETYIGLLFHFCRRRGATGRSLSAATRKKQSANKKNGEQVRRLAAHWRTSRPTARFNWAAAVR